MSGPEFSSLPSSTDNLIDVLRFRSQSSATRLRFLDPEGQTSRELTALDLLEHACGLAHVLQRVGVAKGHRVGISCEPGPGYVIAFFGAILAGSIPVPVYPPPDATAVDRTRSILDHAEIAALVVSGALASPWTDRGGVPWPVIDVSQVEPTADEGRPAPKPDDVAFLQFTSGSTGNPRGVRVLHRNIMHNSKAIQRAFGNVESSVGVSWLPPYHDMGLIGCIIQPIYAGFEACLLSPRAFLTRPIAWLRAISTHRARVSGAPNFAYDLCVRRIRDRDLQELDLSSWEAAFCGAEPVDADIMRRFCDRFAPAGFDPRALCPCYGLAEATLFVTARPLGQGMKTLHVDRSALRESSIHLGGSDTVELVSCGPVGLGVSISVDAGANDVGEVVVGGPSVADGYHGQSSEEFTPTGLRTGDLGFVHDGELYLVGRIKETLIVRGRNYAPTDLETTIHADVDGVRRDRVVAVAWVEDGVVVLAERQGGRHDASELVQSIQAAIRARHAIAVDAAVVPRGTIQTTSSGKLRRRASLQRLLDGSAKPFATSPGFDIDRIVAAARAPSGSNDEPEGLASMRETLAALLKVDASSLDVDAPLTSLHLDSLTATELNAEIQATHGVEIPMAELASGPSLRQLALRIDTQSRGRGQGTVAVSDRPTQPLVEPPTKAVQPSLFFFERHRETDDRRPLYSLVEQAVRRADELGFEAVWLPERHFHAFGAPFPNPAVLAAALAVQTGDLHLRAGSVVAGLHHPLRLVEDWAMIDQLSGGRVGLSFTSGWNAGDFVLRPEAFPERRETLVDTIETVRELWRGGSRTFGDGQQQPRTPTAQPRPVQRELPVWLTCTRARERFETAGRMGYRVLTAFLFQTEEELAANLAAYRAARERAGHDRGHVTLAVHTYVGETQHEAEQRVATPLTRYLEGSVDLWQQASRRLAELSESDREKALEFAVKRYLGASLIGDASTCRDRLARFAAMGVDEVACQIDFGIEPGHVLEGLGRLGPVFFGDEE